MPQAANSASAVEGENVQSPSQDQPAKRARLIAFYLPQFHPIPENDKWWGPGFTEWTDVAKAKPLFPGHYQPHIPADLGFYDLRVPETRAAQAELARKAGIEGFCYWHYYFAGKRLLERPFNEVLASGEPDFPFCLGWANHKWVGRQGLLMDQTYPGPADHEAHFYSVLPAFHDHRYIRVKNKPLFLIFYPKGLPDAKAFIDQWQNLAVKNGLEGIHFVANQHARVDERLADHAGAGFEAITQSQQGRILQFNLQRVMQKDLREMSDPGKIGLPDYDTLKRLAYKYTSRRAFRKLTKRPMNVFDYEDARLYFRDALDVNPPVYPCAIPNWDHSPRSGHRAVILHNSTPELFREHFKQILDDADTLPEDQRIVFIKSWNEWAEGNYLEPDRKFGHQYLDVVREEVFRPRATGR